MSKSNLYRNTIQSPDARQTQRDRIPNNEEEKLLAFVEELIVGLAHNHPNITQRHVATWLAGVAIPTRKVCR